MGNYKTYYRVYLKDGGFSEYANLYDVPEGNSYETIQREIIDNTHNDILHQIDLETDRYLKRTRDGVEAYAKISAEFRMAKLNGDISEETHGYIEAILIPVRNEVLAGQWISARLILESIGALNIGDELYDRLYGQITNYINDNY